MDAEIASGQVADLFDLFSNNEIQQIHQFQKSKPKIFRFDPKPFHVGAIGSSKRGRSEENVELERNPIA